MESNTRTSSSSVPQTWANYVSFRGLTYLSFRVIKAGFNAVGSVFGEALRNTASAAKRIFGKGVVSVSYKPYDGSLFSQAQSNEEGESTLSASLAFPDGEMVDPETLGANNGESTAEDALEVNPDRGLELLNELRNRNSKPSSSGLVLDLPAGASPRVKLNAIMTSRTDQIKANMDRCLGNTLELNEKKQSTCRED